MKGLCSLKAGHKGECICSIDRDEHICNGICNLFNLRNCKEKCILPTNHKGIHHCKTKKEKHLCGNDCILKNSSRAINGNNCKGLCRYGYGHEGICICSNYIHICEKECEFKKYKNGFCRNNKINISKILFFARNYR